ncbi:beta-ketoacyl synthase N-terminal-like domain-containing protein [Streptomyces sp. DH24]|uniref:beta-ketoacyl synthase N-terminal-like domain-containing protein n=1 Tax=Streptomyces sp. DH24 TaxID=3040123 RepID=UPI00244195C5|nr:beta-ketoacyl synthase N-terminal-like domain-containing protein [Streptomyces sp. DH24]MDG9715356.1 beta-ketoacyl synthase N-terminal-like domain-containing protein [Streptomyces sp. DH24]
MGGRPEDTVVTGVGLAVPGLTHPDELLGTVREGGFDPATGLAGRDLRHKDRASRLALRAAEPALRSAGVWDGTELRVPRDEIAVIVSSNLGILDNVCAFTDIIAEKTVTGLSPLGLPQTSSNVIAGSVAMRFGLRGPNITLCNGATSGLDALYWARNLLAVGRARVVLVVGVEPSGPAVTRLLGTPSVDGAAGVVLESVESAVARGARPRATVAGCARAGDLSTAVAAVSAQASTPSGRAGAAPDGAPSPGPVTLWLTGADHAASPATPLVPNGAAPGVPTRDLEAQLGPCSGALGVFQCAAAVAHLDPDGSAPGVTADGGAVLATVGDPETDAVAAALFTPPPSGPTAPRSREFAATAAAP